MDNIDSINMPRSQSPVMLEMRQMAAMAGSGLEFGT
ncbi:flagellar hook-basal body complex protein fliE 1, partial [Yersinia pestis PY-08]